MRLEKRDLRYTPTDCFETFPFPEKIHDNETLSRLGQHFFGLRKKYMLENDVGLTEFYNRFHSVECKEDAIENIHVAGLVSVFDLPIITTIGC